MQFYKNNNLPLLINSALDKKKLGNYSCVLYLAQKS